MCSVRQYFTQDGGGHLCVHQPRAVFQQSLRLEDRFVVCWHPSLLNVNWQTSLLGKATEDVTIG